MARLVMKFGGTSVADIDRIRNVARHVKREVDAGHEVAVVVSAMAGATNQLVAWAREASPLQMRGPPRSAGRREKAAIHTGEVRRLQPRPAALQAVCRALLRRVRDRKIRIIRRKDRRTFAICRPCCRPCCRPWLFPRE